MNEDEFMIVPILPEGIEVTKKMEDMLAAELAKWRKDVTHVPLFPFSVKIVRKDTYQTPHPLEWA